MGSVKPVSAWSKAVAKLTICMLTVMGLCRTTMGQSKDSGWATIYQSALQKLDSLADKGGTFKEAVFTTENTFFKGGLDRAVFDGYIHDLVKLASTWSRYNKITHYPFSDSLNFQTNYAIYAILKDTIRATDTGGTRFYFLPYTYDFSDYDGQVNWASMFVSKLVITHKGNCHSLPYLYKILADELGANCWLALAPNHIYIKNRSEKIGWYNTELTSGSFPNDGWMMASGYLPLQAVQNRIYMDTLSRVQAIALCMLDLAKGYQHRVRAADPEFIIRCCNHCLKLFPFNAQAMLLKAETLKASLPPKTSSARQQQYTEMENLYGRLYDLGYREMPAQMYQQWLRSVKAEENKYTGKR